MYSCKKCGKSFKSRNSLGGHASSHSRKIGMMKNSKRWKDTECLYCKKIFKTRKMLIYCSRDCLTNKRRDEKMSSLVKLKTSLGDAAIDITWSELEKYRSNVLLCEICGKTEVAKTNDGTKFRKLAIDHDHESNKFRGLLCFRCNIQLGWMEMHKSQIDKYLSRSGVTDSTRSF